MNSLANSTMLYFKTESLNLNLIERTVTFDTCERVMYVIRKSYEICLVCFVKYDDEGVVFVVWQI